MSIEKPKNERTVEKSANKFSAQNVKEALLARKPINAILVI